MIRGVDICIRTSAGESSLFVAARVVGQFWPNAVFENGSTGESYKCYWDTPFDDLEEVFIYRDSAAAELWEIEGAIAEALNSMIHVIADKGLTTVVVDDPDDPTMKSIVAAITSGLQDDVLSHFALEAI